MFKDNKTFIFKVGVVLVALIVLSRFSGMGRMHDFMMSGPGGWQNGSNVITVTGKGEVNSKPDIATISFTITKEGKTVAEAQSAVADVEGKALVALRADGVEDKDIKTESSSFNPKYDNTPIYCVTYPCQQKSPKIIGYEAYETISVKVRKLDTTGKIIEELGKTGVTNLYGPNFAIDDEEGLKAEARKKAIEDARAKAKILAKDLGVRLGRITSFSENSDGYPIYYAKAGASLDSAAPQSAPAELPAGENTITSNVSITYSIR